MTTGFETNSMDMGFSLDGCKTKPKKERGGAQGNYKMMSHVTSHIAMRILYIAQCVELNRCLYPTNLFNKRWERKLCHRFNAPEDGFQ